jgi:SAM-dependent methyltransferase
MSESRPNYDAGAQAMLSSRAPQARAFATQILETVRPFVVPRTVLDVGCGYGHTAYELAQRCEHVVGIEPFAELARPGMELARDRPNLEIRHQGIETLDERERFDLIVLDNVFEHLPDQRGALVKLSAALRPGGVLYLLMPNKLWPIEVHYRLPFLSYLPVRLANRYLRWTGRGTDYTDASYAPTYLGLRRMLDAHPELAYQFVLPANLSLADHGGALHYKLGVAAIRRLPALWAISKAFLVVAQKHG